MTMATKIKRVSLNGYKGSTRTYTLVGPEILSGPNGSGKSSCLEGLIYTLNGQVPGGRKLDTVAAYFPARGGTVRVEDSEGRWIERGFSRDKTKLTEILRTSEDVEGQPPNLAAWQVSDVVIDIREFTGLSPEKRREFVLRLCGGGTTPANLPWMLALEYARQVGGPAATPQFLEDMACDPTPGVPQLAQSWTRRGGIRELLHSYLGAAANGKSLSEIFLQLGACAKEGVLGCRRDAQTAAAAQGELEVEAKGASAAASDIDALGQTVAVLREEVSQRKASAAQMREAHQRVEAAEIEVTAALKAKALASDLLAAAKDPGIRPEAPKSNERKTALFDALIPLGKKEDEQRKIVREAEAAQGRADFARAQFEAANERYERAFENKHNELIHLMDAVPDDAHVGVPPLRVAVKNLCQQWMDDVGRLEQLAEKAKRESLGAESQAFGMGPLAVRAADVLTDLAIERQSIQQELDAIRLDEATDSKTYRDLCAFWEKTNLAYTTAKSRLQYTVVRETNAKAALILGLGRLDDLQDPTATAEAIQLVEEKLAEAERALEKANEAAGAVAAYASAAARAARAQVDEKAWKAATEAIRILRERVVQESTGGLEESVNQVLAAAGRQERVYLRLENDRGKPIFEMGWRVGEVEVSLIAMSGGQAVTFMAALSIALTKRCAGRKLLLVEADPLDVSSFEDLLKALRPQWDELEALIVATATVGWSTPVGWDVIALGGVKP